MVRPREGKAFIVRIPDDDVAWLDQQAAILGTSRAGIIRKLVKEARDGTDQA